MLSIYILNCYGGAAVVVQMDRSERNRDNEYDRTEHATTSRPSECVCVTAMPDRCEY